jgi:hypothetical protein
MTDYSMSDYVYDCCNVMIDCSMSDCMFMIVIILYPHSMYGGYIAITLSVRSHFRSRYLSFYWKKWFYIWYMALAWWLVQCLPFPGLPHICFLFTVRLRIFLVCRNENFRNGYLSFYWKKWFYIWYMALAWWLVPCIPFPGLPHIYFLFTVRHTNERVGVFLAWRSVQHFVCNVMINDLLLYEYLCYTVTQCVSDLIRYIRGQSIPYGERA